MELPEFDGTDSDEWISKTEKYFLVNRFTEQEKLEVAAVRLSKGDFKWFKWENKRRPITSWEELMLLMLGRFRQHQKVLCLNSGLLGNTEER